MIIVDCVPYWRLAVGDLHRLPHSRLWHFFMTICRYSSILLFTRNITQQWIAIWSIFRTLCLMLTKVQKVNFLFTFRPCCRSIKEFPFRALQKCHCIVKKIICFFGAVFLEDTLIASRINEITFIAGFFMLHL